MTLAKTNNLPHRYLGQRAAPAKMKCTGGSESLDQHYEIRMQASHVWIPGKVVCICYGYPEVVPEDHEIKEIPCHDLSTTSDK